jgi:hypothetical protein
LPHRLIIWPSAYLAENVCVFNILSLSETSHENVTFGFAAFCKCIYKGKGKGKAIPLQAWTGPEGSRRLRLPDFKTVGT